LQLLLNLPPINSLEVILEAVILSLQQGALEHDDREHKDIRLERILGEVVELLALNDAALLWGEVDVPDAPFLEDSIEVGPHGDCQDIDYLSCGLLGHEDSFSRQAFVGLLVLLVNCHSLCNLEQNGLQLLLGEGQLDLADHPKVLLLVIADDLPEKVQLKGCPAGQ
jgi:hypothetical protein